MVGCYLYYCLTNSRILRILFELFIAFGETNTSGSTSSACHFVSFNNPFNILAIGAVDVFHPQNQNNSFVCARERMPFEWFLAVCCLLNPPNRYKLFEISSFHCLEYPSKNIWNKGIREPVMFYSDIIINSFM